MTATQRFIPLNRLIELLKACAVARGFRSLALMGRTKVMCFACYPDQPERLQYSERRVRPVTSSGDAYWWDVLRVECDGFVSIGPPGRVGDPRSPIPVEDAVSSLVVETCCHDEDAALGAWDWRSDLERAVAAEVESGVTTFVVDLERAKREREAERARRDAVIAAYTVGQQISMRQRVQAVAAVLKAAGKPVIVEQAKLSWECGHVSDAGAYERVVIIVDSDGMPVLGDESCRLHGDDAVPDIGLVLDEYRRVAEMTAEERAAYKPVPEASRAGWRGGGNRFGKTGGKPPAPPKEQWSVERTHEWCVEKGLDLSLGVQALFGKVQAIGGDHPPRAAIQAMKKTTRAP